MPNPPWAPSLPMARCRDYHRFCAASSRRAFCPSHPSGKPQQILEPQPAGCRPSRITSTRSGASQSQPQHAAHEATWLSASAPRQLRHRAADAPRPASAANGTSEPPPRSAPYRPPTAAPKARRRVTTVFPLYQTSLERSSAARGVALAAVGEDAAEFRRWRERAEAIASRRAASPGFTPERWPSQSISISAGLDVDRGGRLVVCADPRLRPAAAMAMRSIPIRRSGGRIPAASRQRHEAHRVGHPSAALGGGGDATGQRPMVKVRR